MVDWDEPRAPMLRMGRTGDDARQTGAAAEAVGCTA
jgi:hypothetical protein